MLGNLVLLRAKQNKALGNQSFKRRKEAYAHSAYYVTRMVAEYEHWGPHEIRQRQEQLAELAVQTWPSFFGK